MTNMGGFSLRRYKTPVEFLSRMQPLLEAQEVKYGLMFGIALNLCSRPDRYGETSPYFAVVEDRDGIAIAALMTPPFGILLFSARQESRSAYRMLSEDLVAEKWNVPTANGPSDTVDQFVTVWQELTGVSATVGIQERVFELRQVNHSPPIPGRMRKAAFSDLDLVSQWYVEFTREALAGIEESDATAMRRRVDTAIKDGSIFLWDTGEPVSLAAVSRKTTHGVAIGPVYTPPECRGYGYASSCVAQLSQLMLDQGYSFCTLFTDLANPTSNRIYARIGYTPVCDYTLYRFACQG